MAARVKKPNPKIHLNAEFFMGNASNDGCFAIRAGVPPQGGPGPKEEHDVVARRDVDENTFIGFFAGTYDVNDDRARQDRLLKVMTQENEVMYIVRWTLEDTRAFAANQVRKGGVPDSNARFAMASLGGFVSLPALFTSRKIRQGEVVVRPKNVHEVRNGPSVYQSVVAASDSNLEYPDPVAFIGPTLLPRYHEDLVYVGDAGKKGMGLFAGSNGIAFPGGAIAFYPGYVFPARGAHLCFTYAIKVMAGFELDAEAVSPSMVNAQWSAHIINEPSDRHTEAVNVELALVENYVIPGMSLVVARPTANIGPNQQLFTFYGQHYPRKGYTTCA